MVALFLAATVTAAPAQSGRDAGESPFDDTTTLSELYEKARDAFGLARLDLAAEFYREILVREPNDLTAMLELANVYERNGQFEYARGLLMRAASIEPRNADIVERRERVDRQLAAALDDEVNVMMAQGNYEGAIPKLALRITIGPESDALYFRRARCLLETGRLDAAVGDLEAAIRIDPQERYYEMRTRILTDEIDRRTDEMLEQAHGAAAAGDRDGALTLLADVLDLDPDNARAQAEFLRLSRDATPAPSPTAALAQKPRPGWLPDPGIVGRAAVALYHLLERWLGAVLAVLGLWIVFRSPVSRMLLRRLSKLPLLTGQLDAFTLQEVLLMINSETKTGQLRVRAPACHGTIWFEGGEPCHCEVGKLRGSDALVRLIDESDRGTFVFVEGPMPRKRTVDMPLSLVLVEAARGTTPDEKGPAPEAGQSRMKSLLQKR